MNLLPRLCTASLVLAAAATLPVRDARACGGCFLPQTETQTTVVTGHRMAFSISTTQSVLWDQIKYAGSPSDFAWVLPVKGGAVVQLSTDAWFETLDAATTAQIVSPPANCGGPSSGGCNGIACFGGAAAEADFSGGTEGSMPPPVTITHQGTIGPYATVTLHANVPNALPAWLAANKYNVDPSVSPIIDAYTTAGFDFIALRLQPGMGVQQMKPVRVVTAGASPSLPLRMVAAGTGPNVAITLFVIGEGRWEPQGFPNGTVDPSKLTWDYGSQSSDYSTQRQALLAQSGGRTWNTAFANQGSLLSQDTVNGVPTTITVGSTTVNTLADAYAQQGVSNGEAQQGDIYSCTHAFDGYAASTDQVVACASVLGTGGADAGAGGSGGGDAGAGGSSGTGGGSGVPPCYDLAPNQIPASQFACGPLDDIATALVGMHPSSVWLTRLEANLPHATLIADLTLQASSQQVPVSNVFNLTNSKGNPCAPGAPAAPAGAAGGTMRSIWLRNRLAIFATILAAVAAAFTRRRRPVPALVRIRAR